MGSTSNNYILTVIIKEFVLRDSPSVLHYKNVAICPIVAIQVEHCPSVCLPFLSCESIQRHIRNLEHGHDFLPIEVEESYLKDGMFVFKQGKMCHFVSQDQSFNNSNISIGISVLNGLVHPMSIVGRCNLNCKDFKLNTFAAQTILKGKVPMFDGRGKKFVIGDVSIVITLQNVDSSIPLVKLQNNNHHHSYINCNVTDTFQHCHPQYDYGLKKTKISDEVKTRNLRREISLNKDHNLKYNLFRGGTPTIYSNSSCNTIQKDISQPIENNLKVTSTSSDQTFAYKSEKLVNAIIMESEDPLKVLDLLESFDVPETSTFLSKFNEMANAENCIQKMYHNKKTSKPKHKEKLSYSKTKLPISIQRKNKNQLHLKTLDSVEQPTGWLRSTPISKTSLNNAPICKITRTTLLRQAKFNPEIQRHLKDEVDLQVKQKLKLFDEAYLKSLNYWNKTYRNKEGKCCYRSRNKVVNKDASQQTQTFHTQADQTTEIGDSIILSSNIVPETIISDENIYADSDYFENLAAKDSFNNIFKPSSSPDIISNRARPSEVKQFNEIDSRLSIQKIKSRDSSVSDQPSNNTSKKNSISSSRSIYKPDKSLLESKSSIKSKPLDITFTKRKEKEMNNINSHVLNATYTKKEPNCEDEENDNVDSYSMDTLSSVKTDSCIQSEIDSETDVNGDDKMHSPLLTDVHTSESERKSTTDADYTEVNSKAESEKFSSIESLMQSCFSENIDDTSDKVVVPPLDNIIDDKTAEETYLKKDYSNVLSKINPKFRQLSKSSTIYPQSSEDIYTTGTIEQIKQTQTLKTNSDDSSVSDISARIAALLVPRTINIASARTLSESSYQPSDLNDDILSSLSDI